MDKIPTPKQKKTFTAGLLKWNREHNKREMPWKGEKDPYRIWISEIILQQTRVEQGLSYYNRFIQTFPDIKSLARAADEEVFKLWEGLGYYSRCRNLLFTARQLQAERKGVFPAEYPAILALKGVGPYTAAAIASFAFQLPHAVLDGNVFRVLSRYFGLFTPADSSAGKKMYTQLAGELLDDRQPGIYNQAIMDFGATVCKPQSPDCPVCPLRSTCTAFSQQLTAELPVKTKKIRIRERWFYFTLPVYRGKIPLRKRTGNDIWQQLYEFPLRETSKKQKEGQFPEPEIHWPEKIKRKESDILYFQQLLSHQRIHGYFRMIYADRKPGLDPSWIWVPPDRLPLYAFPGLINRFLRENPFGKKRLPVKKA